MNTDRTGKKGTHWWNFLDLHPQNQVFFFDSFGFMVFKTFIIQDNNKKKLLMKYYLELKNLNKKDKY